MTDSSREYQELTPEEKERVLTEFAAILKAGQPKKLRVKKS